MSINKYDSTTGDLIPIHSGEVMYADSPIGTISIFSGTTLPNGYLWCNGAEYDIVDYPELYAVLGSNWNGTKTPTTGKFFVPDLRELVPVGASSGNNTTYTIAAHDTYGIGTFKDDQVQDHTHYRFSGGNGSSYAGAGGAGPWTPSETAGQYGSSTGGILTTYRRGTTTHGKQIGVNYIIKAKQTPMPTDMQGEVDDINGEITQIKSDLTNISNNLNLKYIGTAEDTTAYSGDLSDYQEIILLLCPFKTASNKTFYTFNIATASFTNVSSSLIIPQDISADGAFSVRITVSSNGISCVSMGTSTTSPKIWIYGR